MLGCTNAKSTINNRIASNRTMCECMCDLIFNHKSVVILPKSFIKCVFALWLWCVTIDFSFLPKNSFIFNHINGKSMSNTKGFLLILGVHWAEYLTPIWKKQHSIFNADAKNTTEFHWKDQIRKTNTKSPFIDRFKSVNQQQWIANNNLSKPFCQNVRKQRWKIAMQFTSISKTVRIKCYVVYAIDFTVFCIIVDKSLLRLDASGWKERFVRTMGP